MPQVLINVTSSAIGDRVAAVQKCESGTLVSASALVPNADSEPNTIYARVSVIDMSANSPNIISVLTAGYIGGGQAITWTGSIKLFSECALMLETWGNSIVLCRATALTEPAVKS